MGDYDYYDDYPRGSAMATKKDKVLHPSCAGDIHLNCAWPNNCPCSCHKADSERPTKESK